MLQSETTFHPHPSPSPNLIWPAFRVMYLFQSWFEFVFNKMYFPFYSFHCNVSMLSPHIIPTSVLYICWSRPNPLHSFSSSVNVFDWLKSHADAFSFAASKKQTQTRRGSSDLPILKTKTKENKTQKEFENKRKYFRKFMSVFSCQFLLQNYRTMVTWNGTDGKWGRFVICQKCLTFILFKICKLQLNW